MADHPRVVAVSDRERLVYEREGGGAPSQRSGRRATTFLGSSGANLGGGGDGLPLADNAFGSDGLCRQVGLGGPGGANPRSVTESTAGRLHPVAHQSSRRRARLGQREAEKVFDFGDLRTTVSAYRPSRYLWRD